MSEFGKKNENKLNYDFVMNKSIKIDEKKCKSQSEKIKLNEEAVFLRKKLSEEELILEEYHRKSGKVFCN